MFMSRCIKVFRNIYGNQKLLKTHRCPTSVEEHHQKSYRSVQTISQLMLFHWWIYYCLFSALQWVNLLYLEKKNPHASVWIFKDIFYVLLTTQAAYTFCVFPFQVVRSFSDIWPKGTDHLTHLDMTNHETTILVSAWCQQR